MAREFYIIRCFTYGFRAFGRSPLKAVLSIFLFGLVNWLLGMLLEEIPFGAHLYNLLLAGPLLGGLTIFYLSLHDGERVSLGSIFAGFRHFGKFTFLHWLTMVILACTILAIAAPLAFYFTTKNPSFSPLRDMPNALERRDVFADMFFRRMLILTVSMIVMSIIITIRWSLAYYVMADRPGRCGVLEAFRRSAEITAGHRLRLFFALIAIILFPFVCTFALARFGQVLIQLFGFGGFIFILLSLFALWPLMLCALAAIYVQLKDEPEPEVLPLPAAPAGPPPKPYLAEGIFIQPAASPFPAANAAKPFLAAAGAAEPHAFDLPGAPPDAPSAAARTLPVSPPAPAPSQAGWPVPFPPASAASPLAQGPAFPPVTAMPPGQRDLSTLAASPPHDAAPASPQNKSAILPAAPSPAPSAPMGLPAPPLSGTTPASPPAAYRSPFPPLLEPLRIDQSKVDFRLRGEMLRHGAPVVRLALSPDGALVVSAGRDGTIKAWHRYQGTLQVMYRAGGAAGCLAVNPNRQTAAVGLVDPDEMDEGIIKVFSLANGEERGVYRLHHGAVHGLAINGRGDLGVSTGEDRSVHVWDYASGTIIMGGTHPDQGLAAGFTPDGRPVSVSRDWTLTLWDLETKAPAATWRGEAGPFQAELSHFGEWLVVTTPQRAQLIEVASGRALADWVPAGRILAVYGGPEGSVTAWEAHGPTAKARHVQGGAQRAELRGHTGDILALVSSPDGMFVATGGEDGMVGIWEAV